MQHTVEIYLKNQTRAQEIEKEKAICEKELEKLKESSPSSERRVELDSLIELLQKALEYQYAIENYLLESRTRNLERFDHLHLYQFEQINKRLNPIEKNIQQLKKCYATRARCLEQQREIDVITGNLSMNHQENQVAPQLSAARANLQAALAENEQLISLIIQDTQQVDLPFVQPQESKIEEKKICRNNIIKSKALVKAYQLLAKLRIKCHSVHSSHYEQTCINLFSIIELANQPQEDERFPTYFSRAVSLFIRSKSILKKTDNPDQAKLLLFLHYGAYCWTTAVLASQPPPTPLSTDYYLQAAELYEQAVIVLSNHNDPSRTQRAYYLSEAALSFSFAAHSERIAQENIDVREARRAERDFHVARAQAFMEEASEFSEE